jgi:D-alanyl-D-alanine carboxypeptidase/D-alanyl-D-alanine-endopeptidase (penicillin-binding protein 4)
VENVNFKINIINPEKYFLIVFKETLDSNHIQVLGEINTTKYHPSGNFLSAVKRKYSDVIINLNKNSDNLSAEMTLYAIAEKYFGRPATAENGLKKINELIDSLGLDSRNYRLVDGSGVSHYNVVSSELNVKLLKYIYEKFPAEFELLYESFPIAGIDGTLENRMKMTKAYNNVYAKTGTLTGVSCLSGYLTSKKKHTIAFSIMMQNFVGSSKRAKDLQDKICEILSSY